MAELGERVGRLLFALERGGATGLADTVLQRIRSADEPPSTADDTRSEPDPFRRAAEEAGSARELRHLTIANHVVQTVLGRELALADAISQELRALREIEPPVDRREWTPILLQEVVLAADDGDRSEGTGTSLTTPTRIAAIMKLLEAWEAGWSREFGEAERGG